MCVMLRLMLTSPNVLAWKPMVCKFPTSYILPLNKRQVQSQWQILLGFRFEPHYCTLVIFQQMPNSVSCFYRGCGTYLL